MRNITRICVVVSVVAIFAVAQSAMAQLRPGGAGGRAGAGATGPRAATTPPRGQTGPTPANAVPAAGPNPKQAPINPALLVPPLQQAYVTLASADHDYGGHRDAAMKDIAVAASLLGTDITASGTGHEPQAISNLQLTSVQMSLQSVGRSVPTTGQHHVEILNRINSAISQITLAMQYEAAHPTPPGKIPTTLPTVPVSTTQPIVVPPGTTLIEGNSVEVSALEQIYQVLVPANHNYQGHRVAAMNALSRAVTALGGSISGDGGGKENQTVSDAQLQQAVVLLGQVRDSFATEDPKKVLNDLTAALNQLTMALSIK